VTFNNGPIEKQQWQRVKAKIIERFGTVRRAARVLKCHPNAIRYSIEGRCPKVAKRLEKALL
jgi:hypothetical protein